MDEERIGIQVDLKGFNGCPLPVEFSSIKEKIEHFHVRDEDIWVTSYPKSGTTWTEEMVWLIANDLDYEGAKENLDSRFPFIEFNSISESLNNLVKNHPEVLNKFNTRVPPDIIKILDETNGRRMIKSHLPWYLLPRQITERVRTPKIIHVMRDPKQVAVSYSHHSRTLLRTFKGSLSNFIDAYIKGEVTYGEYFNVVQSYWKQRHLPNLLIITYEEMHKDIQSIIKRVSDFLGKTYNENEIKTLSEHLSFDKMKINKAVNKQSNIQNEDTPFMRKGTTDSYKNELSEQDLTKLYKWVIENVKGTGLPYESSIY